MIFMQQMQYIASNLMCVFQKLSHCDNPDPPFILGPKFIDYLGSFPSRILAERLKIAWK